MDTKLNSKRRNYILVNLIVIVFTLLLIIFLNYLLLVNFLFTKELFIVMNLPIILLGLLVYLYLSNALLEPLFEAEKSLQKTLKETLHELNIPASTIQINTQMLLKSAKDEKSIKRLERINKATKDLLELYDKMEYDIKRQIDKVDKQQFLLRDIITDSLEKFQDIKEDIKISVQVDNMLIYTDEDGFSKVIDNLISNAIKYNVDEGEIVIEVIDKNLSFYNTGKSIDTKNIFIVFDKYYQENNESDGFGLGLNIVKEFCDKNKITINIDSLEQGTKISLNLSNIIQ